MLGSFYSSIANNKGLSWDVVKIKTREIAEAVVSKSKNMTEISEKSRSVINDIRSVAIKLSDEQKAEVASYYGFAAVVAALTVSEDAAVVDSALAAVAESAAPALDADADSLATEVPAVEDEAEKVDKASLELSVGKFVESVDELLCAPFNLKAFKKPFTPSPK